MAGRRRRRPRRSLAPTKKEEKVPAGGCGLPALIPRGPAVTLVVDFAAIPPGSSLQSCLKLLPKSTWIRRQRRCLLLWHSCSCPLGLSWGRPKASSPQVSGPDDCRRPRARRWVEWLLSRAGNKDLEKLTQPGEGAQGAMSPEFVPGGTRGPGLGVTWRR